MATKIVTKNSSTASAVPTASDLVQGELAVNVADKRLFTEDNGGAIVELGTNPSTIDINAGTIDGTAIGASSASTGAFTTLTASGAFTSLGIDDNATSTAITIDSSENVGIGTSSPSNYYSTTLVVDAPDEDGITVVNPTTGTGYLMFADGTSGNARYRGYIAYSHSADVMQLATSGLERMRIDSSGNVGVGTSSPSTRLTVGDGVSSEAIKVNAGSGWADLRLHSASANGGSIYFNDGADAGQIFYYHVDDSMRFHTAATERMRITAAGALQLSDVNSPNDINTAIYSNSDVLEFEAFGTNGAIAFTTGPSVTERMRIDSSGNVGVGTSTDTGKLNIYRSGGETQVKIRSDSNQSGNIYFTDATSGYSGSLSYNHTDNSMRFATNGTGEKMRIDSGGRLFVNTTGDYNGVVNIANQVGDYCISLRDTEVNTAFILFSNSAGTAIGSILRAGTGVTYNTSSDQRLKDNIADADDAGSKVDAIQVRKFDWKVDGSHQDYGMIAQELQLVAPEAVSGDADSEEMMGVDYSKLVPMMLKEIQSLRNRVAQLEE